LAPGTWHFALCTWHFALQSHLYIFIRSIMQIKLSKADKIAIQSSKDLVGIMQGILRREHRIDRNREHFWIVGLAANNALLYIELISLGSVKATVVEPMEVFSLALQKRTVRIVLVHNHPSGNLKPGPEDEDITDRLIQVGHFLQVPVLDHLIITEQAHYSFADSGLLDELSLSKKYALAYKEQEKLLAQAKAIGLQEGKKAGLKAGEAKGLKAGEAKGREAERLAMAQVLKAKGVAVGVIAEVTGLSVAKVKGLNVPKAKGKRASSGK
jgi:DNA repair protein RadC